jgi:hypothetical protein
MADQRRPHVVLATICGLSVGAYAIALAAVARSQADHDKALIADRAPTQRAIGLLSAHQAALSSTLDVSRLRYAAAAGDYDGLRAELDDLHKLLKAFGRDIKTLDKTAAGVPSNVDLPGVPAVKPASQPKPPPTDGKTGASGKP